MYIVLLLSFEMKVIFFPAFLGFKHYVSLQFNTDDKLIRSDSCFNILLSCKPIRSSVLGFVQYLKAFVYSL